MSETHRDYRWDGPLPEGAQAAYEDCVPADIEMPEGWVVIGTHQH